MLGTSKASIARRSSFMVLAIGFGPNSLLIFETVLSRNKFGISVAALTLCYLHSFYHRMIQIFDSIFDSLILGAAYDLSTRHASLRFNCLIDDVATLIIVIIVREN